MLVALSIRDIVLIDRLDLDFTRGLSVLTGETGAGKSILLDALTLALGGRGDQGLVRKGCKSGQVSAIVNVASTHRVCTILRDDGLLSNSDGEGDELILRRVQFADGRTRAFINDQAVSAQLLKKVGRELFEIHGQHDERALVDENTHRVLIDAFGELDAKADELAKAYKKLSDIQDLVQVQEKAIAEVRRDEDFARHSVEELSGLAPMAAEEEKLADRRQTLMALEKSAGEIGDADEILSGPSAPSSALTTLMRRLQRKSEAGGEVFLPLIEQLDVALVALDGTLDALEALKREMNFDPDELNDVEERLFALRGMARKHNVTCDELGDVLGKYQQYLLALKSGADGLVALQDDLDKAFATYHKLANVLSARRKKSAAALELAIEMELPDLKLGSAKFMVNQRIDEARLSSHGYDQIGFHVQTNPGTQSGPMLKVASGGELSRILLALKVILTNKSTAPVLIFDEIDTGVGGAVADAMGRRLERLAKSVQVLAVTHAPQVAARANQHLLIEKVMSDDGKTVRTCVRVLSKEEKGEEVARMLAGAEVSDEARAAAQRLISEVG